MANPIIRGLDVVIEAGRKFARGAEDGLPVEGTDPRLSDARPAIPHEATHRSGGSDALTGNVDANARVSIRKNSGVLINKRRRLNLIEGSGVTITVADDPTDEEVDLTFAASGGGGAHAASHVDGGTDEINSALDPRAYPLGVSTLASRPAASIANAGRMWWTTDEHILYVNDSGGTWTAIAVIDYADLVGVPSTFAPSAHKANHQHGGSDEVATATPGANAIPKAGSADPFLDRKWMFTDIVVQAADANNNTVTLANTDLIFTGVANGLYAVDLWLRFESAATTTGIALAWDTSVAVTFADIIFGHITTLAGGAAFGDAIADVTKRGITPSVNAVTTKYPIIAAGLIKFGGTGGTARLQFASEVAASNVLFGANSCMRVMRIA